MNHPNVTFAHDYADKEGRPKEAQPRPSRFGNLLYVVLSEQRASQILRNIDHGRAIKEDKRREAKARTAAEHRSMNDVLPGMIAKGEYDSATLDSAHAPSLTHNVISHRGNKKARQIAQDTPVRRPEYASLAQPDPYLDDIALAAVKRAKAMINQNELPTITNASRPSASDALTGPTIGIRYIIPAPKAVPSPPSDQHVEQGSGHHRSVDDSDVHTQQFEKVS